MQFKHPLRLLNVDIIFYGVNGTVSTSEVGSHFDKFDKLNLPYFYYDLIRQNVD